MKNLIITTLLVLFTKISFGQKPIDILKEFKNGNMSYVAKYSATPFTIKNISTIIDTCIFDSSYIDDALIKILEVITIAELRNSKIKKVTNSKFLLEFRTYNNEAELESESSLTFYFNSENSKFIRLTKIVMAG